MFRGYTKAAEWNGKFEFDLRWTKNPQHSISDGLVPSGPDRFRGMPDADDAGIATAIFF